LRAFEKVQPVNGAALEAQRKTTLQTLVDEWATMTGDEKKAALAPIFDTVTADAEASPGWNLAKTGGPTSPRYPKPVERSHRLSQSGRRGLGPRQVPRGFEAMSNVAFASVGPRDRCDEARKATSCA
jgi:hypothetical protein